jgi:hypothetical protein
MNLLNSLASALVFAQWSEISDHLAPALFFAALFVGGGLLLWWLSARDRKRREDILANGQTLKAWLVQANNALFQEQYASPGAGQPAQFLISFDESIAHSQEFMLGLARKMARLKGQKPTDPDERKVAKLVTNEAYRPGCRDRLPESFTGGPVVYAIHLVVEIVRLPARRLDRPYVYCKAMPGDSGWVFMTDYPPEGEPLLPGL